MRPLLPNSALRPHPTWICLTVLAYITILATLLVTQADAWAAGAGKTIAVYVEGTDADAVRAAVLAIVPERLHVTDAAAFSAALAKAGQRGAFGPPLTQAKQR